MNTTTIITGVGAAVGTGFLVYDRKEKKINKEVAGALIIGTAATAATAAGGATINSQTREQIRQKYSSEYVESMTDEQLAEALTQMNLLLPKEDSQIGEKTI